MSAADDASPVSLAEATSLFHALADVPVSIVAVSGGADSTALMVLLARWRAIREPAPRFIAVTVDHGLRSGSKREAIAVGRLAGNLDIEHRILRWTGRKATAGLQQAARLARYRLLDQAAREAGARHVITAHTLDDQAETVLMRMARGSGVGGLAGMGHLAAVPVENASGAMLLRPLLSIPKSRLLATLKASGIPFATDPTNSDPRFTRSRLRTLMPALAREGLTAARLATLARRVARIEDALRAAVNEVQEQVAPGPWPDAGPVTLDATAFAGLPPEIALRLLGRAIEWTGDEGPVELAKLEGLYGEMSEPLSATRLCRGRFGKFRRTLAGALVSLANSGIVVERAPPRGGKGLTTAKSRRGAHAKAG